MHSMSCYEIRDIEGWVKADTIYKHIRILESYGLVEHGAKIERANGYILTQKAIDLLPKRELNKDRLNLPVLLKETRKNIWNFQN